MPIKLNIAKPKNYDTLRAEYLDTRKDMTAQLDNALRKLISEHREKYQQHVASVILARPKVYIEQREEGQTVEEFYRKAMKESMMWRQTASEVRALLRELTDYDDNLTNATWNSRTGRYTPFAINFLRNAQAIAYKLANKVVEESIATFLYRTKDKLVDLIVAYPKYDAMLLDGGFYGGVFEGTIGLTFQRPDRSDEKFLAESKFNVKIGLKYNTSVLGNPYVQYPLTFHAYKDHEKTRGITGKDRISNERPLSENGLTEHFSFVKWEPPVQTTTRFKTVGTGSIIVSKTNQIVLVARTKKVKGTLQQVAVGIDTNGTAVEVLDDQIKTVLAEIKSVRTGFNGPHFKEADACTVYFEEGVERMDFGLPTTDEKSFSKREQAIRVMAFQRLAKDKKLKLPEAKDSE